MNVQYISDNKGHTTAVQLQIPIEEWEAMKKKYAELADEENDIISNVPDWQMDLVRKEIELVGSAHAELKLWEEARGNFKFKS